QEIMLILDDYMKKGLIKEAPVFIEGMISEATAIHTAYPEYLSREVRNSILHEGENPFQSEYFTVVEHPSARQSIIEGEPCIIMATSGMLEGGPVIEYFKGLAEDERNMIVFVSYQIEGTLGRRVQKGINEVAMMDSDGKMSVVKVRMHVESIEGFSGHSDRRQIINYITQLKPRPEKVIVCHGERAKIASIASFIQKRCGIPAVTPSVMETVRLL
ncbi:MAG: MBL fold metallo-hydrolase RNA specificity domain-containing protein, partial [Candidatus Bathyarchaeia archaeon]